MKFFFDNNFPPVLAIVLRELCKQYSPEAEIYHLREKFNPSTPDSEWITSLASEGNWVILTRDRLNKKGSKGSPERVILKKSNLTAFMFSKSWGNRYRSWDLIWNFIRWWPTIMDQANRVAPGVVYMVPDSSPDSKAGKLITL